MGGRRLRKKQLGTAKRMGAVPSTPLAGPVPTETHVSRGDTYTILGLLVGVFLVLVVPPLAVKIPAFLIVCGGLVWLVWKSHITHGWPLGAKIALAFCLLAFSFFVAVPQFRVQWRIEHPFSRTPTLQASNVPTAGLRPESVESTARSTLQPVPNLAKHEKRPPTTSKLGASRAQPFGPTGELSPEFRDSLAPEVKSEAMLLGMSPEELRKYVANLVSDLKLFDHGWQAPERMYRLNEPSPIDPEGAKKLGELVEKRERTFEAARNRYHEEFTAKFTNLNEVANEIVQRCQQKGATADVEYERYGAGSHNPLPPPYDMGVAGLRAAAYLEALTRKCL